VDARGGTADGTEPKGCCSRQQKVRAQPLYQQAEGSEGCKPRRRNGMTPVPGRRTIRGIKRARAVGLDAARVLSENG